MSLLNNRIFFEGNPWPNGHAIKELKWWGRLVPESGLWFDLHLVSDKYYAEDVDLREDGMGSLYRAILQWFQYKMYLMRMWGRDYGDDWKSKALWSNFHNCVLSTAYFGRRVEDNYWGHDGFLVGTPDQPFDFGTLSERTFEVDRLPIGTKPSDRSFGIYLLGHDGVANHQIKISETGKDGEYTMDWNGEIALEYSALEEERGCFSHKFHAQYDHIEFAGFEFPDGMNEQEARQLLRMCTVNSGDFKTVPPLVTADA